MSVGGAKFSAELAGLPELKRLLDELPEKVQRKVMRGAVSAGATVVVKEARRSAPRSKGERSPASLRYGQLHKNIRKKYLSRRSRKNGATYRVDVGSSFWGAFEEFGSSHQAPDPFFGPAFDRSKGRAQERMAEMVGKGIEREAAKLAKKHRTTRRGKR